MKIFVAADRIPPTLLAAEVWDLNRCTLFEDFTDELVQVLLFVLCCGFLVTKWVLEVPRRSSRVFLFDVMKQTVAVVPPHFLNMVFSVYYSHHGEAIGQCSWFWSTTLADATVGVLLNWFLLRLSERVLLYKSGDYRGSGTRSGDNDIDGVTASCTEWAKQTAIWCVVTILSQAVMYVIMLKSVAFWRAVGVRGTHFFHDPFRRLLYVMVASPIVMNTLQIWVTDNMLRYEETSKS
eukprot:TRINITY_DN35618_c0_g1_i1.p1 TRINITY_DN35618_c0_g1~~TRINITY_DN35618_c0_g1_i1.p1  ORF type:complete len:236 (+),score=41.97 TRINITY_DN35618_c0_g1_i1:164-871(+)